MKIKEFYNVVMITDETISHSYTMCNCYKLNYRRFKKAIKLWYSKDGLKILIIK